MVSEEKQQQIFKTIPSAGTGGISRGTDQSGESFNLLNHREHR